MYPICSENLIYDHNVLVLKNYGGVVYKAIFLHAVRKKGYVSADDGDPP